MDISDGDVDKAFAVMMGTDTLTPLGGTLLPSIVQIRLPDEDDTCHDCGATALHDTVRIQVIMNPGTGVWQVIGPHKVCEPCSLYSQTDYASGVLVLQIVP